MPGPCDSPAVSTYKQFRELCFHKLISILMAFQCFQLIRFFMSYNLRVRDLRIENSPQFHFKFDGCENVQIEGISINSPALSPNTDGIHVENTKSVFISNSFISNGDDCISIGPGCSMVEIDNVTCGPSHGIRCSYKFHFFSLRSNSSN